MKNLHNNATELLPPSEGILTASLQRRSFLQFSAAGMAGIALTAIGCKKDEMRQMDDGVNLGSGDIGIINYAYA